MVSVRVNDIVRAVSGELLSGSGDTPVQTLCTDSRQITPRCLFLPIVGERFDAHDFIDSALNAGAAGCLCSRAIEHLQEGKFYIRVEDTLLALKALAVWYRSRFHIPFVQITGSVGKTTTKEMLSGVLATHFHTLKTEANFNSDIGVPRTMLALDETHECAVIETGMDHFGEIRYLGEIVRPQIAVITNVGDVHAEYLGSREGVFKAKCEIFENLDGNGVAILNGDDALLRTVRIPQRTVFFGTAENCAVRISDIVPNALKGVSCTITTPRGAYELTIPAPGAHMAYSAAIAVAVSEELGLSREEIVCGIEGFSAPDKRMSVEELAGGRIMLDDSYNANPQSMTAALQILAQAPANFRIAMLGDMKELGAATEEGHRGIGDLAGRLGIDVLLCIGPFCRDHMVDAAKKAGCADVRWYEKKEDTYEDLVKLFGEGSALLLKGSHFANRLDLTADYLREYKF